MRMGRSIRRSKEGNHDQFIQPRPDPGYRWHKGEKMSYNEC
jgi:hypothetical protein